MSNDSQVTEDIRHEYFDFAQVLLGSVITNPDSHHDTRFAALMLSSYVPIFKKRCFREVVTAEDCRELYDSIGAALALLRPLEIDQTPQSIMMEAGCQALSARSSRPDNLLYPTSPREEASPYAQFNHDSYFIAGFGRKIPLQQKLTPTSKTYDDSITLLSLLPLLEKGSRRAGIKQPESVSERVNYLLGLIVAETHRADLSKNEKQLLDFMTRSIIAHKRPASMTRVA